jgi:hypothetical protein
MAITHAVLFQTTSEHDIVAELASVKPLLYIYCFHFQRGKPIKVASVQFSWND